MDDDSTFLHLDGSMSDDWSTQDGPPILGCWVCESPMIGRQKTRDGHTLIGHCDTVFILTLSVGDVLGDSEDAELIKQWILCDGKCWAKARSVIQKLVEQVGEQEPILVSWSERFQELTGLEE